MADPGAVDPFHDPYDGPFTAEELFNVLSNDNPSLIDLSLNDPINAQINTDAHAPVVGNDDITGNNPEEISNPMDMIGDPPLPEFPLPNFEITEVDEALDDRILSWNFTGESSGNNAGDFSEGDNFEGSGRLEGNSWQIEKNVNSYEFGETSMPRRSEEPSACSGCQTLRELIHTNGQDITRLDIRGRVGFICCANLEIQPNAANSEEYQFQTFHFRDKSLEEVKNFLEQYCLERVEAGFIMVQDSLASFYQTMSIGLDLEASNADATEFNSGTPLFLPAPDSASAPALLPAPIVVKLEEGDMSIERDKKKTPLAAQRERTGKLTLKDIGKYFHLPIQEAARNMKLCPTVIKKICRRGGLARWPHRKIKSIERKISMFQSILRTARNPEDRARAESEIQKLENDIEKIRAEALKNFE